MHHFRRRPHLAHSHVSFASPTGVSAQIDRTDELVFILLYSPLLNSMPKNIRSMVADSLTRALNRIDGKLETGLVPPLARIPLGSATNTSRRDLPSSMLAWRLEEEGSLLRAEAGDTPEARSIDTMSLGMNAEIVSLSSLPSALLRGLTDLHLGARKMQSELEQMLLPEAEQIVGLSKTLEHQTQQLEQSQADIARLKRERKLIKSQGTSDYPPNLEVRSFFLAPRPTSETTPVTLLTISLYVLSSRLTICSLPRRRNQNWTPRLAPTFVSGVSPSFYTRVPLRTYYLPTHATVTMNRRPLRPQHTVNARAREIAGEDRSKCK